jgi:galactokinase/mevalonate kinase-like predicted kinase
MFNICIITASNKKQADAYRELLAARVASRLYPREVEFVVLQDPEGGRVGSGGGTLWALLQLLRRRGVKKADLSVSESDVIMEFLNRSSILIIHAAGESRRLPAYAPEGKLFAPLPVSTSSLLSPSVLDAELNLFFKYPWRLGEVVVASGDVIIGFDADSVPDRQADITGFAKSSSFEQGSHHGVFKFDDYEERVVDFYQKSSISFLRENARIEGTDECALDIGLVSMSAEFIHHFIRFADIVSSDGETIGTLIENGRFNFDLYLEIMTSTLTGLSKAVFVERVSQLSKLSKGDIEACYDHFHRFSLGGILTRNSKFLHFGSMTEYPKACIDLSVSGIGAFYAASQAEIHPSVSDNTIQFNCHDVIVQGPPGSYRYAENCADVFLVATGNCFLSGIRDWNPSFALPSGICVDERSVFKVRMRIVYFDSDSFKPVESLAELQFCGVSMEQWLSERLLSPADLWNSFNTPYDIYTARLYPEEIDDGFLKGYFSIPEDFVLWHDRFMAATRYTLSEINAATDVLARDAERKSLRSLLLTESILSGNGFFDISKSDFKSLFQDSNDTDRLVELYKRTDDPLLKDYRRELVSSVTALNEVAGRFSISFLPVAVECKLAVAIKEDQIVWARSPLRFDIAGGWTDTPPYTNRFGGRVVNVSVDLNGQSPIQVFVRKTKERFVRIHSIDLGVTETITRSEAILDYQNPTSPFALPKAALTLLGLVTSLGLESDLPEILEHLGGGIEITLLCAVPKGSGLGTSSILGGTILAALHRFFGLSVPKDELFLEVLEMERMLTTGGGWQDQIGGIVGGVKHIETKPGLRPRPMIYQLDPFLFEDRSETARMTLFYTGITRLAKNILKDVVSEVNSNSPAYLFTHDSLKILADEARVAISMRNRSRLGSIISESWAANKRIHPSTTNEEIEEVLAATSPHWRGMKLLGAGGGGFAFFISDTEKDAECLQDVLRSRFENDRARLVNFSLNKTGLEVTVS